MSFVDPFTSCHDVPIFTMFARNERGKGKKKRRKELR
jgi:hypothetical protein